LSAHHFEVLRLCIQSRRYLRVKLVQSVQRSTPRRRTDSSDGSASARCTRGRIVTVSDENLHRVHRHAESFSRNESEGGPGAGPGTLRSHFQLDGAVRLNRQIAIARMSETSPRMNGEPETPLDRSRRLVAALMPFGLPAYELAGDLQLVGVNL